ncbi:Capsular glucan synthase [compost metagenome]
MPEGPAVDAFAKEGFRLRILPNPSLTSLPTWVKTISREVAEGVDLVHVHAAMEMVWASRLAHPARPTVFTSHGYHLEVDYMKAGLMLNRSAGAVIAVSEFERSRLLRYGLNPSLTRVVPNGIDLDGLDGPAGTLRQELSLPEGSRLIGMVNRLDAFKGVDLMLKALPRLRERDPRLFLIVVGDGPERARLEALTRSLGVEHAVRWLGRLSQLGNSLRSFDVFVTPTRKEAFGMAAAEAMACGVPVVATDLPALRALVTPGHDGELIPEEAGSDRWAQVLADLLSDNGRLERYASAARTRAAEFGVPQMALATEQVYRGLAPVLNR